MPKYSKETVRSAKRWFASFKTELAKLGISFDNPVTLSLVRVRDTSDTAFIQEEHETAMKSLDAAKKALNGSMLAFAEMNEQHGYAGGFQPHRDRLDWMRENLVKEDTISDAQIVYLYHMCREGRLYIMSDNLSPERFVRDRNVVMSEDGGAVICPELDQLINDEERGGKLYRKYGYTAESFDKARWETLKTSANYNTNFLTQIVWGQEKLDRIISVYKKIPGEEEYVAQARQCYQDFEDLKTAQNMGLQYAHAARKNPSWFQNPGNAEIISRLGRLIVKPEEELTGEEKDYLSCYPVLGHEYMVTEESLLKTAEVKDSAELMRSDIITDAEGQPIRAANEIEYMSVCYHRLQEGELCINGIPYTDLGNDLGLVRSIGKQEYDLQARRICDILTDSDMEEGGLDEDPGYEAFKKAALGLAHGIQRGLKNPGYGFKELQAEMQEPVKAAQAYLEAHGGPAMQQGIYAERRRAARELLELAGKAGDQVRHPMEKPDSERIARKRRAFHAMLNEKHIDTDRYEDTSAHLFYHENGVYKPLLPEDYARMSHERFNREIVPRLESGEVYLSERDSTSFRRVSLKENVRTGTFTVALGREKSFAGSSPAREALHQQRVEAVKGGEERAYQVRLKDEANAGILDKAVFEKEYLASCAERMRCNFGPRFSATQEQLDAGSFHEGERAYSDYRIPDGSPFSEADAATIALAIFSSPGFADHDRTAEFPDPVQRAGENVAFFVEGAFTSRQREGMGRIFGESVELARVETGRVLREYAAGNKAPLAEYLCHGINMLSENISFAESLGAAEYNDYQQLSRQYRLLTADPELAKLAMEKNIITEDNYVRAKAADKFVSVYEEASQAKVTIAAANLAGRELTAQEKLDCAAKICMADYIAGETKRYKQEYKSNREYANAYARCQEIVNTKLLSAPAEAESALREIEMLGRREPLNQLQKLLSLPNGAGMLKNRFRELTVVKEYAGRTTKALAGAMNTPIASASVNEEFKRSSAMKGLAALRADELTEDCHYQQYRLGYILNSREKLTQEKYAEDLGDCLSKLLACSTIGAQLKRMKEEVPAAVLKQMAGAETVAATAAAIANTRNFEKMMKTVSPETLRELSANTSEVYNDSAVEAFAADFRRSFSASVTKQAESRREPPKTAARPPVTLGR